MALTLLDTSTLIASLMPAHPQNAWATTERAKAPALCISAHTLAEGYKVLTVHPQIKMPLSLAETTLKTVAQQVTIIELENTDYQAALTRCTRQGLSGSVIFDALIAQAALKAGAEQILTLNPKDFKRLGEDVARILVYP